MTNKYEQLEQRINKHEGYDENIVFNTVVLTNRYTQLENNPEKLKRFECDSVTRYKLRHNLSVSEAKYNIDLVKSLQNGTDLELPGYENNLYVQGDRNK